MKSAKAEGKAEGKTEGMALTLEAIKLIQAGENNAAIHKKLGVALDMIEALRQQIYPKESDHA